MSYKSIDELQKVLQDKIFRDRKDSKKAAGRALGTFVEIITFYLLESWGIEQSIAIERRVTEYGNPDITHNVEFTLHPLLFSCTDNQIDNPVLPLSANKLKKFCPFLEDIQTLTNNQLVSADKLLRNACTLYEKKNFFFVNCYLASFLPRHITFDVSKLFSHPYAMIECKRVGIEEGMKKGPQTIEKAKQGAYVARMVSSLQKIRGAEGEKFGVLSLPKQEIICKPYSLFLKEVIASNDPEILKSFTLTVGIASNHGNWFTSDDHNKEMKVLAQSYDWLLFLTDDGLAEFVADLLLSSANTVIRDTFQASYLSDSKSNRFTKVKMDLDANIALRQFFRNHQDRIEKWFNVIAPKNKNLSQLKQNLSFSKTKNGMRF